MQGGVTVWKLEESQEMVFVMATATAVTASTATTKANKYVSDWNVQQSPGG